MTSRSPRGGRAAVCALLWSMNVGAQDGAASHAREPQDRAAAAVAYQRALATRRLDPGVPLTVDALRARLLEAQDLAAEGRHDEVIGSLLAVVESPRFDDFAEFEEGHAAVYALGDALASVGAHDPARVYLKRLLHLSPADTYARRAVRRLVEIALDTEMVGPILLDLSGLTAAQQPEETRGELAYLKGRGLELGGDVQGALASYAAVSPKSRFWAQAVYLSGLIEVERGRYAQAENLFCQVAEPARSERSAPFFADDKFFAVRDFARLALGRLAHEQFRFDDSRYYYYLVPQDSERLAESLYESATGRYEKKDYEGARELLDELSRLAVRHRYEDEAWVLSAYVDLARCHFAEADRTLQAFVAKYEPVRNLARDLIADDEELTSLLASRMASAEEHRGALASTAGRSSPPGQARATDIEPRDRLAVGIQADPGYAALTRRLELLDREVSGLRGTVSQIDGLGRVLVTSGGVRPAAAPIDDTSASTALWAAGELAALLRQLTRLQRSGAPVATVAALRQVQTLQQRVAVRNASAPSAPEPAGVAPPDLGVLLTRDRASAVNLFTSAAVARASLSQARDAAAKDALRRLHTRWSRLLRRARLGRIESVLGKKRALEVEVEALALGVLPRSALDALDTARYLHDNEEYWPFEGDDWPDEYVGGEGLR